jgi:Uma2 family endonuclease
MTQAAANSTSITGVMPTGVAAHNALAHFPNLAEWWHSTGDVPLERIVTDPPPGTATEQDLLLFAERDKRLCELIDGTLVAKPVGYMESLIAGWLITALNNFVMPRKLGLVSGEAGMIRMVSGRVRLPDVAFVSFDDLPGRQIPREPIPTLPPTLAVEVLSESNTATEIRQKLKEYFESGTRLAWVIDPRVRVVDVYVSFKEAPARTLRAGDLLDGGSALPGFTMPVSDLFASLPED